MMGQRMDRESEMTRRKESQGGEVTGGVGARQTVGSTGTKGRGGYCDSEPEHRHTCPPKTTSLAREVE